MTVINMLLTDESLSCFRIDNLKKEDREKLISIPKDYVKYRYELIGTSESIAGA